MVNTSGLRRRRSSRAVPALGVAALLVALVACSGSGGATNDAAAPPAPGAQAPSEMGGSDSSAVEVDRAIAAAISKRVTTGSVTLEVDVVLDAVAAITRIATAHGGAVADEQTMTGRGGTPLGGTEIADLAPGTTTSTLTLRLPPAAYDESVAAIGALGVLLDQTRTSTDVTDQYVDAQARVTSQQASLTRLVGLLDVAGDLADVVTLENEISRRQADLDALMARLAALDDAVVMSTLVVTVVEPGVVGSERSGFTGGLARGWDAFASATGALVTGVGALLPFAAFAGLLLVLVLAVRRRLRAGAPSTPAPAEGAGVDGQS